LPEEFGSYISRFRQAFKYDLLITQHATGGGAAFTFSALSYAAPASHLIVFFRRKGDLQVSQATQYLPAPELNYNCMHTVSL